MLSLKQMLDATLVKPVIVSDYKEGERPASMLMCDVVDRAYLLDTNIKSDSKALKHLKVALRNFSDETGDRELEGESGLARITEGKETTSLKTERVREVLEELHNKGVISTRKLNSCFVTATPAHKVTLVSK